MGKENKKFIFIVILLLLAGFAAGYYVPILQAQQLDEKISVNYCETLDHDSKEDVRSINSQNEVDP